MVDRPWLKKRTAVSFKILKFQLREKSVTEPQADKIVKHVPITVTQRMPVPTDTTIRNSILVGHLKLENKEMRGRGIW